MVEYAPNSLDYMLSAGRGKAIIDILEQGISKHRDLILDHCVRNKSYDRQLEGSRADYLYPLIRNSGEKAFYREKILQALIDTKDEFDADQLFDFAVVFARDGDTKARSALYEKFGRHDLDSCADINGSTQLIELDGVDGLITVLDYIGSSRPDLLDPEGDIDLIQYAEEQCGVEEVRQALAVAEKSNPNIAKYLQSVSGSYTTSLRLEDVLTSHKETFPSQDFQRQFEGLTWVQIKRESKLRVSFARWGISAPDREIINAAYDIPSESDPDKLAWYLRVFWKRDFPLHPDALISLFYHPSFKVSHAAMRALMRLSHPEIRDFYERLVQVRDWSAYAVELLRKHYRVGDHITIEHLLEQETDVDLLHSLVMHACEVFQDNLIPEAMRSLLLVYEKSPCSNCRRKSVEIMQALGQLPDWILE